MKRWLAASFSLLLAGLLCLALNAQAQMMPLTGAGGKFKAGSSAAAVTWDALNTDGSITLSPDKLTASIVLPDASNRLSRATVGVAASSKVYWEILGTTIPSTVNATGLGFADSSFTIPQNNFLGFDTHGLGHYGSGGSVFTGGSSVDTWDAYITNGDVISYAVDTTNNKIWGRVNSGGWNMGLIGSQNPATNTGGLPITFTPPLYPALVFRSSTGATYQITGRFSAASWTLSAPAGFGQL